jgi:hypothetical protein
MQSLDPDELLPTTAGWDSQSLPSKRPSNEAAPAISPERADQLQLVPETGISGDFWNEFFWIVASHEVACMMGQDASTLIISDIKERPCKTYEERYPKRTHSELYSERALPVIARLNTLIHELNERAADGSLTVERAAQIFEAASAHIHGSSDVRRWLPEKPPGA